MERGDDLGAVDPLEVDAGYPQVAMPQLTVDRHQWHALACELDSMTMPQLMRRKSASDAGRFGGAAQLFACRGGFPAPPSGGAVDHAEQRPDRQRRADLLPLGEGL